MTAIAAQTHGEQRRAIGQNPLKRHEVAVLAEDAQTPVRSIENVVDIPA